MTYKETENDFVEFVKEMKDDTGDYKESFYVLYLAHILIETNSHLSNISKELKKLNQEK